MIREQEQIDIVNIINTHLNNKFNYKKNHIHVCDQYSPDSTYFRLDGRTKHFGLYLRFGYNYLNFDNKDNKAIILANIRFTPERNKHGTDFLRLLVNQIAVKYDYKRIGIESVNSKSTAFANYFNFFAHPYIERYYYADVSNLVKLLKLK